MEFLNSLFTDGATDCLYMHIKIQIQQIFYLCSHTFIDHKILWFDTVAITTCAFCFVSGFQVQHGLCCVCFFSQAYFQPSHLELCTTCTLLVRPKNAQNIWYNFFNVNIPYSFLYHNNKLYFVLWKINTYSLLL